MFNIIRKKKESELDYLERVYTTTLKKYPNSFLYLPLASVYYRKNCIEKAIQIIRKAVSMHPGYATAKCYLAFLYSESGETDKAIELYKKTVIGSPDNFAARQALVRHHIIGKDKISALSELKELSLHTPFNRMVQDQISQIKQKLKKDPLSVSPKDEDFKVENRVRRPEVRIKKDNSPEDDLKFSAIKKEGLIFSKTKTKIVKKTDKLEDESKERVSRELPLPEAEKVKDNNESEKIVSALEKWLKNIDKISHKV